MFAAVNAGKESVVLDLKTSAGRAELWQLLSEADCLLEGFRPGVLERLGFGYGSVARERPGIVYCSISGYGADGPYRELPGHDLNYLGVAGGIEDRRPPGIGVPVVDLATGTIAALSILASLVEAKAGAAGRYLDIAMLDSAYFWSTIKAKTDDGGRAAPEPAYGVHVAADSLSLSVAAVEDKFWRNLCAALGWEDWREHPAFATHARREQRGDEVAERLAVTLRQRPRTEWLSILRGADVPAAPVNSPWEAQHDPQIVARGLVGIARGPQAPLPAALRGDLTAAPSFENVSALR
jgi:crotonobetainyl-CoA:carnitine CoA-transferase CaiB-like acyl-CoA transferase